MKNTARYNEEKKYLICLEISEKNNVSKSLLFRCLVNFTLAIWGILSRRTLCSSLIIVGQMKKMDQLYIDIYDISSREAYFNVFYASKHEVAEYMIRDTARNCIKM